MWFLKFLVFVACAFSVFSDEVVRHVMEESEIDISLSENIVVYGIISELASISSNVSLTCTTDLTRILRSINKLDLWAIKGTYRSYVDISPIKVKIIVGELEGFSMKCSEFMNEYFGKCFST